jgi:hypothetical protein
MKTQRTDRKRGSCLVRGVLRILRSCSSTVRCYGNPRLCNCSFHHAVTLVLPSDTRSRRKYCYPERSDLEISTRFRRPWIRKSDLWDSVCLCLAPQRQRCATFFNLKCLIFYSVFTSMSRDSSRHSDGLAGLGSIPVSTIYFFCSPQRPDRLWSPPSLLSNGYRGIFLVG